jgi:hypothetical protein
MIIYISGPITGLHDRNRKAFQKAQTEIAGIFKSVKVDKLKIINPVKMGYKLDKKLAAAGKEAQWADYMRVCIKELCDADFVFFIANWENSEGAIFEHHIANRLQIPCAVNIKDLTKLILEAVK